MANIAPLNGIQFTEPERNKDMERGESERKGERQQAAGTRLSRQISVSERGTQTQTELVHKASPRGDAQMLRQVRRCLAARMVAWEIFAQEGQCGWY